MAHPLRGLVVCSGLFLLIVAGSTADASPPDIVVFLSDDHTLRDSSVYGSPDIATPNMDRLAAAGMVFDRAYVASPSCAPSRAALLTGLYPARNGAEPNHSRPKPDLKKLPAYFQEMGYQVVSFGKVGHYKQTPEYGFDIARHFNYHEDVAIPEAVAWLRQRKSQKPLCLFVGTNWPHVPWPDLPEGVDPDSLVIPPTHVDNPTTRAWRKRYVAAIANMDRDLGLVYDAARAVLGDDTFFLHTSDHGAQWPFAKWNLYQDGIHTPLIVSWPGKVKPGTRTDAMVSWIDILPTLVDVAGGPTAEGIDGRSFLPVLLGEVTTHRDLIYTTHSGDGNKNVYPTRSVLTADGWHYIWNLHPEFLFTSHVTGHPADSGYWQSWLASAAEDEVARRRVEAYQKRPAEELYNVSEDPWQFENLVESSGQAERRATLRGLLEAWMDEMGDTRTTFGQPTLIQTHAAVKSAEPK
jgi:N-sulfoglucosamine sulfohydrolase